MLVGEGDIQCWQIVWFGFQYDFYCCVVGIVKEFIVQLGVDVFGWYEWFGFGIDCYYFFVYLWICLQQLGVFQIVLNGDFQLVGILWVQGIGLGQYWIFI